MERKINEALARNLIYYMSLLGMSQKELSDKMGVSEATISNWVKGVKFPRADKVDKLCEIFDCNRSDFLKDSSQEIDSLTQQHMTNYSHLSDEWKNLIDELIKALQEEPQDTEKIWAILGKISIFLRS